MKRQVTAMVFGMGIAGGLFGCVTLPVMLFTVRAYDSPQEVWALYLCVGTTFPACVLALRRRFAAGLWLTSLGCFWMYAVIAQRSFKIHIRTLEVGTSKT
jgi:hypothetical protein